MSEGGSSTDGVASSFYASLRVAAFSFALSSWVEGYSMLRYSISTASAPDTQLFAILNFGDDDEAQEENSTSGILRWLRRKGRKMDDTERSIVGLVDITTALGTFHALQNRPLLPFLLTPLLTAVPLPRPSDMKACRWSKVLLASFLLCVIRELEKVLLARCVAYYRKYCDTRDGVYSGPVIVRGARLPKLPPSSSIYDDDENQLDCMICSGQNDMSQSIASLSSTMTDPEVQGSPASVAAPLGGGERLGPLEAFCTVAPTKHVAHRECFLRWHSAYQAQGRPTIPGIVSLTSTSSPMNSSAMRASSPSIDEVQKDLRRARALLRAAEFMYLIGMLRPSATTTAPTVPSRSLSPLLSPLLTAENTSITTPFIPTFTLHPPKSRRKSSTVPTSPSSSSSRNAASGVGTITRQNPLTLQEPIPPNCLATLRTECPPCPGCRSAVEMHFCAISSSRDGSSSLRHKWTASKSALSQFIHQCHTLMKDFANEANSLITGRTIAVSFSTQCSFLLTIWSMARARDRALMIGPKNLS